MAKTIKITSGKHVISIESDDASVPDVTQDAGPDLLQLQEDAMAAPKEENAEFNAAIDDSPVESEDKTQDVDKANESFFNSIFGFEDGEEATVTDGDQSDTPVTPDNPNVSETPNETNDNTEGEGAGEVTEGDGVTTIDTGDVVITISNTDNSESETPETPKSPETETTTTTTTETPPDESGEGCNGKKGGENSAPDQQNTDQAIESFFANLGL